MDHEGKFFQDEFSSFDVSSCDDSLSFPFHLLDFEWVKLRLIGSYSNRDLDGSKGGPVKDV